MMIKDEWFWHKGYQHIKKLDCIFVKIIYIQKTIAESRMPNAILKICD